MNESDDNDQLNKSERALRYAMTLRGSPRRMTNDESMTKPE